VEEPAGAVQTGTAEQTEELLGAMPDQKQAENEPENEQTCIHDDPNERVKKLCHPAQLS
jgi:hypothetical protein